MPHVLRRRRIHRLPPRRSCRLSVILQHLSGSSRIPPRPPSLHQEIRHYAWRRSRLEAGEKYQPVFFAYHENSLYCASKIGQKIEWMRENPLVAVEVDEIDSAQQWESVIVFGRYEEFANTPETRDMRELAWSLLQKANAL